MGGLGVATCVVVAIPSMRLRIPIVGILRRMVRATMWVEAIGSRRSLVLLVVAVWVAVSSPTGTMLLMMRGRVAELMAMGMLLLLLMMVAILGIRLLMMGWSSDRTL